MPNPQEPGKNEHPSTYFVQDRQNQQELMRLTIQDHLLTASMGGVLPEQPDPSAFRRVLDIGCGSGSWALEAAQAYPTMSLVGIDVSSRNIAYTRARAEELQLSDRVEFRIMDALRGLEFPHTSFDLVNLRLGISFLRTWDWPALLIEMLRVTRPGGVLRLTDQEVLHSYNGPAYRRCNEMFLCAFYQAGHLFERESNGLTAHLAPLLARYGCQQVQTKVYPLEYRAGTAAGQAYCENMTQAMQTARPFLQKWGCATAQDESIFQQASAEMQLPDFYTTWHLLTAWGYKRSVAR